MFYSFIIHLYLVLFGIEKMYDVLYGATCFLGKQVLMLETPFYLPHYTATTYVMSPPSISSRRYLFPLFTILDKLPFFVISNLTFKLSIETTFGKNIGPIHQLIKPAEKRNIYGASNSFSRRDSKKRSSPWTVGVVFHTRKRFINSERQLMHID